MMDDIRLFEQRRKDRLVKRMRSTFNTDERARLACIIYKTCYRTDGGPGSGNHNHAGVPGQRGGSAPNGAADSTATGSKLAKLKDTFSNQGPLQSAEYLTKAGIIPKDEGEKLYNTINTSEDDDELDAAFKKVDEYTAKYFDALESSYEPKSLEVEKRDELLSMDEDEMDDWLADSSLRKFTPDEAEWANDDSRSSSEFQKFVIDVGLNETPQTVCEDDFNKYVEDTGAIVAYRGIADTEEMSAASMVAQMLYAKDEPFVGNGVFGDGLYFANTEKTARAYGEDAVVKCAIRPDAKIAEYDDILNDNSLYDYYGGNVSIAAVMQGYDAIHVGKGYLGNGESYYTVLNKAALIVSDPMDAAMNEVING